MHIAIPILSLSWHGGTRVLVQFANYLASRGHQVSILVSRGRALTPYARVAGVTLKHVGIRTPFRYLDYVVYLLCLPFAFPRASFKIATFFVSYYPMRIANWLDRQGHFYFVQDVEAKYGGPLGRLLNAICVSTYHDSHIIAANDHLAERLKNEFGVKCSSVNVGPGSPFYEWPSSAQKAFDVLYFLRREPWKGLDRFQEFLRITARQYRCLCISQDVDLLRSMTGPNIVCRQPKDDQELIECVDSANLMLFTSYHEGLALPPLECMARGVPVVLYPCGGPNLYVEDGVNAIYVRNAQAAATAVHWLLSDDAAYIAMGAAGRRTSARYRIDHSLAELEQRIVTMTRNG